MNEARLLRPLLCWLAGVVLWLASATAGACCDGSVVLESLPGPLTNYVHLRITDSSGQQRVAPVGADRVAMFRGLVCGPALVEVGEELPGLSGSYFKALAVATTDLVDPFMIRMPCPPLELVSLSIADGAGRALSAAIVSFERLDGQGAQAPATPHTMVSVGADGALTLVLPRGPHRVRCSTARITGIDVGGVRLSPQDAVLVRNGPVRLRLLVETGTILRGRVVDETGAGVPGVPLIVTGATNCARCASTDASGRFTLSVAQVPVNVFVTDIVAKEAEPASIEIPSTDAAAAELTFVLRAIGGTMRHGVVVERPGGPPVENVPVHVRATCVDHSPLDQTAMTDVAGAFAVTLPDACQVWVRIPEGLQDAFVPREWQFAAADWQEVRQFEIERGGVVSGVVLRANRAPAAHLALIVQSASGGVRRATATDADGVFRVNGLPDGEYFVGVSGPAARGPDWNLALVDARERPPSGARPSFELKADQREVRLELALLRGARLCVTAVDREGKAVLLDGLEVTPEKGPPAVIGYRSPLLNEDQYAKELCSPPLLPGGYYVRVGRVGGPLVPSWWPGVAERQLAEAITLGKKEVQTFGPMVVTPAGKLICVVEGVTAPMVGASAELAPVREGGATSADSWRRVDNDLVILRKRGDADPVSVSVLSVPEGIWRVRLRLSPKADPDRPIITAAQIVAVARSATATVTMRSENPTSGAPEGK